MNDGYKAVICILAIILIFTLIIALACNTPNIPCEAELIMPGNTVVIGTCTKFNRISSGWVNAEIDGREYYCNEWRIVLRGN